MELQFVNNIYLPDLNAYAITDELSYQNGEFLYKYLQLYLTNDKTCVDNAIAIFMPNDTVEPSKVKNILYFFSKEENKKWLARQMYLVNSYSGIIDDKYTALKDDVILFFNWLINRDSIKASMMYESPLQSCVY